MPCLRCLDIFSIRLLNVERFCTAISQCYGVRFTTQAHNIDKMQILKLFNLKIRLGNVDWYKFMCWVPILWYAASGY
jgi:hypothetical protein